MPREVPRKRAGNVAHTKFATSVVVVPRVCALELLSIGNGAIVSLSDCAKFCFPTAVLEEIIVGSNGLARVFSVAERADEILPKGTCQALLDVLHLEVLLVEAVDNHREHRIQFGNEHYPQSGVDGFRRNNH